MFRRCLTVLLCTALLSLALGPGMASAHGPKREGVEVDHSQTINYRTGNCMCFWNWYTLGLQPGKVSISLSVGKCTLAMGPVCAASADLYRGSAKVKEATASCYIKHSSCKGSFKATLDHLGFTTFSCAGMARTRSSISWLYAGIFTRCIARRIVKTLDLRP
jgi:hypothetical protein